MAIEREMLASPTPEDREAIRTRLKAIEQAVNQLKLPLAFADQLCVLRDHVATVSRRLQTGFYASA
jgi:hypothetical protein